MTTGHIDAKEIIVGKKKDDYATGPEFCPRCGGKRGEYVRQKGLTTHGKKPETVEVWESCKRCGGKGYL